MSASITSGAWWFEQLQRFWQVLTDRWVIDVQPSHSAIVIALAVALCCVSVPVLWRRSRGAATIIHEMGHVVAARLVGRKIHHIEVHSDTSGLAVTSGKRQGFGLLLMYLAGYPAPSLLGAALAVSVLAGYAGAGLTIYQVALLIALALCRNWFGRFWVITVFCVTGAIWWWGSGIVVATTVLGLAVLYTVAGLRTMVDVTMVHHRHQATPAAFRKPLTTDLAQASKALWFPTPVGLWFLVVYFIGIVCCVVVLEVLVFQYSLVDYITSIL